MSTGGIVKLQCPNCGEQVELSDSDSTDDLTQFYGECKCEYYYNLLMRVKEFEVTDIEGEGD